MKRVALVDCENMQHFKASGFTPAFYFISDNTARQKGIRVVSHGKNSLDYVLISVLANQLSHDGIFIVFSDDRDYDPVLEIFANQGYLVMRKGDNSVYVPSILRGFYYSMVQDILCKETFYVSLRELYDLRQKRKLTVKDVRKIFPDSSLVSRYIALVGRALSLKMSSDEFIGACSGVAPSSDPAFNASLSFVKEENSYGICI